MATKTMKPIKIAGEFMWCNLKHKNEMSEKFQLDICNLSDAAVKALEECGGKARSRADRPEKGNFITAVSHFEIPAVDTSGNPITETIGNGSKGHVVITPYSWTFGGRSGVNWGAQKVVVTSLVRYEDGSDVIDGDDEVL